MHRHDQKVNCIELLCKEIKNALIQSIDLDFLFSL